MLLELGLDLVLFLSFFFAFCCFDLICDCSILNWFGMQPIKGKWQIYWSIRWSIESFCRVNYNERLTRTNMLSDANPNFISDGKFAILLDGEYSIRTRKTTKNASISRFLGVVAVTFLFSQKKEYQFPRNFNLMERQLKALMLHHFIVCINDVSFHSYPCPHHTTHTLDNEKLFYHRFFVCCVRACTYQY